MEAITNRPLTPDNTPQVTTLCDVYQGTDAQGNTVQFEADTRQTAKCYGATIGLKNVKLASPQTIADFYNE